MKRFFPILFLIVFLLAVVVGCDKKKAKRPCCLGPCKSAVQVIAYTASWCGPCQKAKPTLKRLQAAGVSVQWVDIDDQPDAARQAGVSSVPTFFVRTGGRTSRTQDIGDVLRLVGEK